MARLTVFDIAHMYGYRAAESEQDGPKKLPEPHHWVLRLLVHADLLLPPALGVVGLVLLWHGRIVVGISAILGATYEVVLQARSRRARVHSSRATAPLEIRIGELNENAPVPWGELINDIRQRQPTFGRRIAVGLSSIWFMYVLALVRLAMLCGIIMIFALSSSWYGWSIVIGGFAFVGVVMIVAGLVGSIFIKTIRVRLDTRRCIHCDYLIGISDPARVGSYSLVRCSECGLVTLWCPAHKIDSSV